MFNEITSYEGKAQMFKTSCFISDLFIGDFFKDLKSVLLSSFAVEVFPLLFMSIVARCTLK